jgi:hypothetical protein
VAAGAAGREATVAVEPGKISNLPVALDLGVLEIETALPPAAAARSPLAVWHRLYRQGEGSGKPPVINIEGSKARIELPAGAYKLQTIFGGFEVETAVTVRAGDVTRQAVAVVAGEAKVNALPGKGRRACDAFEAGKDRKSGPRARAAGVDLSFILEPGLYDIVCRRTDVPSEIAEGRVQVVAGETQDVKFDR